MKSRKKNLHAVQRTNVVEGVERGRETTVKAENLIQRTIKKQAALREHTLAIHLSLNEGRKRKVIEEIGVEFPDVGVAIFPQALIIEPINLSNLTTLVVATKDREPVLVANL